MKQFYRMTSMNTMEQIPAPEIRTIEYLDADRNVVGTLSTTVEIIEATEAYELCKRHIREDIAEHNKRRLHEMFFPMEISNEMRWLDRELFRRPYVYPLGEEPFDHGHGFAEETMGPMERGILYTDRFFHVRKAWFSYLASNEFGLLDAMRLIDGAVIPFYGYE